MLLVVWLMKISAYKQFSLTLITAPLSQLRLHDVYCMSYCSKLLQVFISVSATSLSHQLPHPLGTSDFWSLLHLRWHADLSSLNYSVLCCFFFK